MADLMAPLHKAAENMGLKICDALIAKGYKSARYAATGADAAAMALEMIAPGESVGVPGTVTVRQIGLMKMMDDKGITVYQHWTPGISPADSVKARMAELSADWFITSSNAVTYDGMMVNIDGTGNRVAGISWTPGKLLFILSVDKAAPDLMSAIERARSATAPNSIRLGGEPPCVKAGHCVHCDAPNKSCRVISILERAPMGREVHAILVGEKLGY